MNYLTEMPTETMHEYGIHKTLLCRRETIYLKHIMKNVFEYGDESDLHEKLDMLQFKSVFQYVQFLTNKLRGIYKITRVFKVGNVDDIVKVDRNSICKVLEMYQTSKPLIIVDFDKTVTNNKFHPLYNWMRDRFTIYVNSANPDLERIRKYFEKHNLTLPSKIYANKGKKKKIVNLKVISNRNIYSPIFYFDDEVEYLKYGVLLGMYCYEYTKSGKCLNYTGFEK